MTAARRRSSVSNMKSFWALLAPPLVLAITAFAVPWLVSMRASILLAVLSGTMVLFAWFGFRKCGLCFFAPRTIQGRRDR